MIKFNIGVKCTPKQKAAEIIEREIFFGIESWLEENANFYSVKEFKAIEDHLEKYSKRVVKLLGREEFQD